MSYDPKAHAERLIEGLRQVAEPGELEIKGKPIGTAKASATPVSATVTPPKPIAPVDPKFVKGNTDFLVTSLAELLGVKAPPAERLDALASTSTMVLEHYGGETVLRRFPLIALLLVILTIAVPMGAEYYRNAREAAKAKAQPVAEAPTQKPERVENF